LVIFRLIKSLSRFARAETTIRTIREVATSSRITSRDKAITTSSLATTHRVATDPITATTKTAVATSRTMVDALRVAPWVVAQLQAQMLAVGGRTTTIKTLTITTKTTRTTTIGAGRMLTTTTTSRLGLRARADNKITTRPLDSLPRSSNSLIVMPLGQLPPVFQTWALLRFLLRLSSSSFRSRLSSLNSARHPAHIVKRSSP